jgi:hypothetical protein
MQQTHVKSKAASIIEGRINGGVSEETETIPSQPKRQFIVRETPIKGMGGSGVERIFHIKRDRVLLTPSMCTADGCSFDVAVRNGYPGGWDTVPERFKDGLLDALAEHRVEAHTVSRAWIIDEDEMPREWLGERRQ